MALSVIFTEKASDGINLQLNLREELQSWDVICPNPSVADAMRTSISRYDGKNDFQTLTINKFLQDLFLTFFPSNASQDEQQSKLVRKSELLKYLATIWKSVFPDERESYFHQAFNLFTDLRSFTLNPALIEDILSHYDEVVAKAIRYFWKITDDQRLIDEHQAYQNILNALSDPEYRDQNELFPKGLIFSGFTHLSGNQVELLKFIGKYTDVVIPIPSEIIKDSLRTDWVDWVRTQADHIEEFEPHKYGGELRRYSFSRGQGNLLLKELTKSHGEGNVLFVNSSIGMKEILEVPKRNYFYKSELELFEGILKTTKENIEEKYLKNIGDEVSYEELKDYLSQNQKEIVLAPNKKAKDFLTIKLLGSLIKELDEWADLSAVNEVIRSFDMQILLEMTKLNLPRNFNIPILKEQKQSILGLKDLYQIDLSETNFVFVDSGHDLSMGGATQYPKDVQEILITLGPMRRKGLDLLFHISQIKEILSSSKSILLLESGLEKHDPTWNQLLSDFDLSQDKIKINKEKSQVKDQEVDLSKFKEVSKLSPTRMQSYLECPRKYYYQYILKLGEEPEKKDSVDSRVLGDIEHAVVQEYLKAGIDWSMESFDNILNEKIKELPRYYLEDKALYDEIYAEVRFFAKQSITELLKLKVLDEDLVFEIEWKMKSEEASGSADVIGFSKKMGPIVIDLKRSSGSIPDKKEIEELRKIQLWYYLNFSFGKDWDPEDFTLMGYINLSDPDQSLVFYQDSEIASKLEEVDFLSDKALIPFKKDVVECLEAFNELYQDTLRRMNVEKKFEINPESVSNCLYCPGSAICSRVVGGVS